MFLFHARGGPVDFSEGRPIFLGRNAEDVVFYAYERGEGTPTIYAFNLSNRASIIDEKSFEKLIEDVTEEEIAKYSGYEGYNRIDAAYIPRVMEELDSLGYNAIEWSDTLENDEIPIIVVCDKNLLKYICKFEIEDVVNDGVEAEDAAREWGSLVKQGKKLDFIIKDYEGNEEEMYGSLLSNRVTEENLRQFIKNVIDGSTFSKID